jgi:hypothetical protein
VLSNKSDLWIKTEKILNEDIEYYENILKSNHILPYNIVGAQN